MLVTGAWLVYSACNHSSLHPVASPSSGFSMGVFFLYCAITLSFSPWILWNWVILRYLVIFICVGQQTKKQKNKQKFELYFNDKCWVHDNTQYTYFSASGILGTPWSHAAQIREVLLYNNSHTGSSCIRTVSPCPYDFCSWSTSLHSSYYRNSYWEV